MDAVEDLLATIFLAAMAILVVAGLYLYQGVRVGDTATAVSEPTAKLVTTPAKP